MSDQRVSDLYTGIAAFESLLDRAEDNAKDSWETEFVSDVRDKFTAYELEMFWSDKQDAILQRIANHE